MFLVTNENMGLCLYISVAQILPFFINYSQNKSDNRQLIASQLTVDGDMTEFFFVEKEKKEKKKKVFAQK